MRGSANCRRTSFRAVEILVTLPCVVGCATQTDTAQPSASASFPSQVVAVSGHQLDQDSLLTAAGKDGCSDRPPAAPMAPELVEPDRRLAALASAHPDVFTGTGVSHHGRYLEAYVKKGHEAHAATQVKEAGIGQLDRIVVVGVARSATELTGLQTALMPQWQRYGITAAGQLPMLGGLGVTVATTAPLTPTIEDELRSRGVVCIERGDGATPAVAR